MQGPSKGASMGYGPLHLYILIIVDVRGLFNKDMCLILYHASSHIIPSSATE